MSPPRNPMRSCRRVQEGQPGETAFDGTSGRRPACVSFRQNPAEGFHKKAEGKKRSCECSGVSLPDADRALRVCLLSGCVFVLPELPLVEHVQFHRIVRGSGQLLLDRSEPGVLVGPEEHGGLHAWDRAAEHGGVARHRVLPEQEACRQEAVAHGVLRAGRSCRPSRRP